MQLVHMSPFVGNYQNNANTAHASKVILSVLSIVGNGVGYPTSVGRGCQTMGYVH